MIDGQLLSVGEQFVVSNKGRLSIFVDKTSGLSYSTSYLTKVSNSRVLISCCESFSITLYMDTGYILGLLEDSEQVTKTLLL